MLWIRDILVRIRIPIPLTNGSGSSTLESGSLLQSCWEENYRFNPSLYTSRQYEETVGEPGEVIISSLYKEGEGQVFVLPATEGEQQQQQHHVEFVIPTTCEQVVEVEVEYPS